MNGRIALFVVSAVLLCSTEPAQAWLVQIDGEASGRDQAFDVVIDPAGDIVAGGVVRKSGHDDDVAIVKLAADTGAEIWRRDIAGEAEGPGADDLNGLSLYGSDVLAAGRLETETAGSDFMVARIDGPTGAETWRVEIDGGSGGNDLAVAAVEDGLGNVVAVGQLRTTQGADFAAIKLDGATGAEMWRTEIDGGAGGADGAFRVRVDAAGNAIAVGYLEGTSTERDLAAIKLDGATGTEIWRYTLDRAGHDDRATDIALDTTGDVFVSGVLSSPANEFTVLKLDGATGAELWRQHVVGSDSGGAGAAFALALDSSGGLFAAGQLAGPGGPDFAVVKLDAATGAEIWRQEVDGGGGVLESAADVAADASGNAIVAGALDHSTSSADEQFDVIAFDGATGAELWRQELKGSAGGGEEAVAVTVGASGEVAAAGWLLHAKNDDDFFVAKLDGKDGSFGSLAGRVLLVKDPGDPDKRLIRLVVKDEFVVTGLPGSAFDPRVSGATLELTNRTTLESASFALPASDWKGLGNPSGSKGYKFKASAGPCSVVTLKPRKMIKAVCNAKRGSIPFTLDESSQGALAVALRISTASPQCTEFGGDVLIDAPTLFKAKKAPAGPFVCP